MTIDQILHKLRTAFLGLVLALSLFMPTSTWADSYITDVILVGGTSSEVSKAKSSNSGYSYINFDLNSGAGGDYIYLGYKTSASANLNSGYITDFIVIDAGSSTNPPSSLTYNSRTYYRTSADGGSHFEAVHGNLNSNCGSKAWNLYLYYTKSNFSDHRAVSSISINTTKGGAINAYNTSGSLVGSAIDLNRGMDGSTDVYMHIYTATKKNRLSSDPVMASGLVYNGQSQKLIKTAATVSSGTVYYKVGSGSYTSTVSSITAISAGSYTVYYYAGSNDYSDASDEQSKTVTIAKSPNSSASVYIASTLYADQAISPSIRGTNLSKGSITYKYATSQNGSYRTTQPFGEGTYWVKATISGDGNCDQYTTSAMQFSVYRRFSDATVSIASSIVYGESLNPTVMDNKSTGSITYKYAASQNGPYSTTKPTEVGTYWVKATIASDSYYYEYTTSARSFEIVPKEITITWGKQTSFVYNGTEQAPTATARSLVAGDECVITISGAAKDAGKHTAIATALSNNNYKLPADVEQPFEITPKEIDITWGEQTSFVYNGTDQAPTATAGSLVSGDECLITVQGAKDVGKQTATATALSNGNYKLPADVEKPFEITKAPLTISAKNKTITYGDEPADNGVEYSGFVGEDDASVLGGTLMFSTDYEQNGPVGEYAITPSNLTSDNYEIEFVNGSLTVEPKEITINWGEQTSFVYNGTEQAPTATVEGLVNGDECVITISGSAKDAGKHTATATALSNGNYKLPTENLEKTFEIAYTDLALLNANYVSQDGEVLTGSLGGNYKISIADGATVTLDGVTINGVYNSDYQWAGITCEGNCNIVLAENSVNTVKGFYYGYPGIYVPEGKTLTISGTGSLDASSYASGAGIGGGKNIGCGNIMISGGTIVAKGGTYAAGIGGGHNKTVGDITISGGTIVAKGGTYAAGIGGGYLGSVGNITITDDIVKVTATAGTWALYSVGVGDSGSRTGDITIGSLNVDDVTSSTFTFTGETYTVVFDANDGEGEMSNQVLYSGFGQKLHANEFTREGLYFDCWNTEADGSGKTYANKFVVTDLAEPGKMMTLYAQWSKEKVLRLSNVVENYVAQDGDVLTGTLAGNYKISIADGATVVLDGVTINGLNKSVYNWSGITCEGNCNIVLADNSVNTVKGFDYNYPGIYVPEGKTLTISGTGYLDASSNGYGAGIGGGRDINCGNIVISGGTVMATGGSYAAGIGGGYFGSVGNITISDGVTKVTAIKGADALYSVGVGTSGTRTGTITIGSLIVDDVSTSPFVYLKKLTVTAKNKTIAYGDEPADNGVEYSGFLDGDDASVLSGTLSLSTDYKQNGNVGEYSITPFGLTSDKYNVVFVNGSLTVEPKEITIAWGEQTSFVYNGTEQAPTATVGSLVAGDECVITVQGAKDVGKQIATATALSNVNYKLPEDVKKSFEITPKEVSIAWGETLLHYNGTEQAPTATAEGLVDGDECSVTVSGAAKDVGMHTASVTALSNNNYRLPTENLEKAFEIAINLAALEGDFIAQDGDVLTGLLGGNYKISIADGATVALNGVTINGKDNSNYEWAGITCDGDCNIILAENSVNTVKGFYCDYPGIYVPEGKTLTISGSGSLDASSNGQGAGIGGGWYINCGNIVISGGSVKSTGGLLAAGIGGGNHGSVGNITISGGTVESTGGWDAAGIGGGDCGSVGNITISGGTVESTGGSDAAGIGGGYSRGSVGNITISGGVVTATGGNNGTGIGSGKYNSSVESVTISGGIVTASGWLSGAGIGSGDYNSSVESVTISGGVVTASGGENGVGIGSGYYSSVGNITITDDVIKVTATKGTNATNSVGVGRYGSRTGVIAIGGKEYEDIETSPFVYLRKLTVTAKNKTIVYGDEPSDNGVEYAGFLDGDDLSVLSGTLSLSTDYKRNGPVGDYSITPDGLTSDKYNIVFESGTLTVEPKEVSIAWGETLLHYNGTEQAPTATAEGLVNGDECSVTVSGAAKDVGKHTAIVTGLSNNNYKLPKEKLEMSFEIAINLAALNEDFIAQDGDVLKGALGGNYKVSIADGATVTLSGVTINGVNDKDYNWAGITCEGDCNIVLAENSVNTVKGFYGDYPGIYVPEGKTLTISGSGSLDATSGGDKGAGIGCGNGTKGGNIVITGGSVTASGGRSGAGIGSGSHCSVDNVLISGGVVTASGGRDGSGVGSGVSGSVKSIVISGGVVSASGGAEGAGIGSGADGTVESVSISGGVVTASGGKDGSGIGSGYYGSVGNITITDNIVNVTATKGNSTSYSIGAGKNGTRTGVIIIGGKEYEDISESPFVYPTTVVDKPAVQVYKYSSGIRAIINADYTGKETLSVPTPIEVDSVEVTRALTPLTPATTVLPFKLPDGTTLNAMFYYLKEVVQEGCSWNATMKYIGEGNLPQANTPYAVILNKGESKLKFDMHGKQATVQTGKIADGVDETGKWYFKGLYSYRVWRDTDKGEDNEIGLAYGFAGSNEDGVAKGEFGRIVDGAYAVPMRSYLRKANASVRLNCNASAPARVRGLVPYQANYASAETGVINVRFVEEDDSGVEKTTAVGRMNAATGEIQIDRWYDLKGRRVNNVKRAAKGAYYGKKVLKK